MEGWLKNIGVVALTHQNDGSICSGVFILNEEGYPIQKLGVSSKVKGLYFVRLSGQRSIASTTL